MGGMGSDTRSKQENGSDQHNAHGYLM